MRINTPWGTKCNFNRNLCCVLTKLIIRTVTKRHFVFILILQLKIHHSVVIQNADFKFYSSDQFQLNVAQNVYLTKL